MEIDTFVLDPLNEPERYFAEFLNTVYIPDSVRPKDEDERWCIPINFDKLNKILEENYDN